MSVRLITLSTIAAGFLLVPVVSSAGVWHDNNDSITFYPTHFENPRTRAEVLQELKQAQADGSLYYLQLGLPVPEKSGVQGKTREQVKQELQQMTNDERQYRLNLYGII